MRALHERSKKMLALTNWKLIKYNKVCTYRSFWTKIFQARVHPQPPVVPLYYLATLRQHADAHTRWYIHVLYVTDTPTPLVIYIRILAANKFSPHSPITTFRTRQLKFLNGTFKSSHNRRQSRIAFAIQCVSHHPSASPSFCRTFPPLTRFTRD